MMMSQVEYAAHIGKTKQYVNKLVRLGKIPVQPDGKIDAAEADFALKRAADPARSIGRADDGDGDDDPSDAAQPASSGGGDGLSFTKARTAREAYQAKMAKLEYERQIGLWLPKQEVLDAMVASGRKIRQGLDAVPSWADDLAALMPGVDQNEIRKLLRAKVRVLEQMIADSLTLSGQDDDGEEDDS
ncbi:putative Terminase small subunit [Magnetospirillum sp. XM-1]|uniref:hypothetical protein n=1 Tax=Magnetospirillum sp. XM-1 TaxID=1663591 RepID=UPI00073DF92B|nr:hypothetical protein [Magnetospirillum sp. XM-1]CUW39684.1 putative Terminase small subunit [Magnetospirillum sp. XM-1]